MVEEFAGVDEIEWNSFLTMISVERTAPFIKELGLPFEQEQYPTVMRLARACLEANMFRSVVSALADESRPDLTKAWQVYRKEEGVLEDNSLREFDERYGHLLSTSQEVFIELQGWIGLDLANSLKEWFINNYRSTPDLTLQWPWALKILLQKGSAENGQASHPPLTAEQRADVERFLTLYYAAKSALEMQFYVGRQTAKFRVPTLWESVLQAFPIDGLGNNYPWLGYVEECLQLRLFRQEWEKLKAELGAEIIQRLTAWIRLEEKSLPYHTPLTVEPT